MLGKCGLGKEYGLKKYVSFFLIHIYIREIHYKFKNDYLPFVGDRSKLKYILDVVNHYLHDLLNFSSKSY